MGMRKWVYVVFLIVLCCGCVNKKTAENENGLENNSTTSENVDNSDFFPVNGKVYVASSDGLNLRADYDIASAKKRLLPQNTVLTVLEIKETAETIDGMHDYWYKVNTGDETGWVFGGYLSFNPINENNRDIQMPNIIDEPVGKLHALSSDDFIVQQAVSFPGGYRPKIYLSQAWGEAEMDDKLIKTETREQLSGYKDVVIYYYENIEIITARFISDAPYRWIVDITITGKKYCMISGITVGDSIKDVIAFYGKPDLEGKSENGEDCSIYSIDDPRATYNDVREYGISFIHKNNIITKIMVYYVWSV